MARAVHKADIDRAIKALQDRGETIGGVVMRPNGEVEILTGKPGASLTALERWEIQQNGRHARQRA